MEYLKDGHYLFPPEHFLAVHFNKIKIQVRYFPNYMLITRTSKGSEHELYNNFMNPPLESTNWSDVGVFEPVKEFTFKKDIKDDFIV
jgi:hypothetical protein